MPSKSPAQARLMTAACKSKEFAAKVGISRKTACEWHREDKREGIVGKAVALKGK